MYKSKKTILVKESRCEWSSLILENYRGLCEGNKIADAYFTGLVLSFLTFLLNFSYLPLKKRKSVNA